MSEEKAPDMRVVLKGPEGDFNVDRSLYIIVHCSDNKYLEVPKEMAASCTFIKASGEEDIPEFDYPAAVLENLVRWSVQYGPEGKAASDLPHPCVYRDFVFITTDAWDKAFFVDRLCSPLHHKHYLVTMTAAEKFGMDGLLNFMIVALGCMLRGKDDSSIVHDIMGVDKEVEVTDADLENVSKEYPWFNESVKPTTRM